MRAYATVLVIMVGVTSLQGCHARGAEEDNYGPPAGYAVLAGAVRDTSGAAIANVVIAFTRCASPIGGFLAAATSDSAGVFRVVAALPPVGVLPRGIADTLRLRCYVFVARSGIVRDSVLVRFATPRNRAPLTEAFLVVAP